MCLCFHVCLFFFCCRAAKCFMGQEEEELLHSSPTPSPLPSVTALLDSKLKLTGFNPARARHFTANQEEKCSISCKRIQNEGKWAQKRVRLYKSSEIHREQKRQGGNMYARLGPHKICILLRFVFKNVYLTKKMWQILWNTWQVRFKMCCPVNAHLL